jgi:hypothetical protein
LKFFIYLNYLTIVKSDFIIKKTALNPLGNKEEKTIQSFNLIFQFCGIIYLMRIYFLSKGGGDKNNDNRKAGAP